MELQFNREEVKYEVEEVSLSDQECVTMVELFVKHKLPDTAQEVFYTEMIGKEVSTENVKNALYQAILSNVSVNLIHYGIEQYEKNPAQFKEDVENYLENKQ